MILQIQNSHFPHLPSLRKDIILWVPSSWLWSLLAVLQLVQAQTSVTNLCELGHNSQLGKKHKTGTSF